MKKILLFITLISFTITYTQIVNIPDANFKNELLSASSSNHIAQNYAGDYVSIDTNNDGEIQENEALNIYSLNVQYKNIYDLTGIEKFTNLTHLNCSFNYLSELLIDDLTHLNYLDCINNRLTAINVNNNTNLTHLFVGVNQLTNIDISNNLGLVSFGCNDNLLTTVDVSLNVNLTTFRCFGNQLTTIDVSNNTDLTTFQCFGNQLTTVDVSNNANLVFFDCSLNQLTAIDVSNNTNLSSFHCNSNQLTAIDISNNTNLSSFHCNSNQLTAIVISNNTNLSSFHCSSNQLTTIDLSNNTGLYFLDCSGNQLTDIDVSNNIDLYDFDCSYNQLTVVDVSNNTNLSHFDCSNNQLTVVNVSDNTNLSRFDCSYNQLTDIDVSNNIDLYDFDCSYNQLTNLDVSNNSDLDFLDSSGNLNLTYINLKNGNNNDIGLYYFHNLPNLQTVCVDELNTAFTTNISTQVGHPVTFTEYCSFEPAKSNIINGSARIDLDHNGCDINDIVLSNLLITADNGTESFGTYPQNDGTYLLYTNEGTFNTTLTTNLPNYFTATPANYTNTFTGFNNTFTADFCVVPNQTVNDVNVSLIPISQARPGFNATYQIVYKNIGTTQLNGNLILEFDENKLNFLNASETVDTQTSNSLSFNYSNLNPFETRTIDLEFNVFAPPTVNIDDILSFTASINPIASDFTADDNVFELNQIVVGSYDPNDITCLEGDEILLAEADKYLHYVIRFQNTGTVNAINVVVKNVLDANLDWSTLQLESYSHNNRVAITNGNEIEFIFENINLPDSTTDEPNSHGFIAYKIKPKAGIALGDIIPNKADIFFDFNAPIQTNTATTTIVNTLGENENILLDFSVYPIPTKNILNVKSKTEITKIEIFNKLGQLILQNTTENKIDISNLSQGIYFVKVKDVNGNFGVRKIVKQ